MRSEHAIGRDRHYRTMLRSIAAFLASSVVCASGAGAQTTTTYSYDALGRLIQSDARAVGTGTQTNYSYDKASNRTDVQSTGAYKGEWLNVGDALHSGEAMLSSDGHYKLLLQRTGDLVLFDPSNAVLWDTGTAGTNADQLVMQGDGNLVLYAGAQPLWATGTTTAGSRFVVQVDGNLVIYSPSGPPIWARFGCC